MEPKKCKVIDIGNDTITVGNDAIDIGGESINVESVAIAIGGNADDLQRGNLGEIKLPFIIY